MVNASLRSYIIHHDQSGLSRPNHKEKGRENDNIHKCVVNVNKAINDFKTEDFLMGPMPMELYGG
jgi:hypothetical protein